MELLLSPAEARVLGSMVEKEATTPEYYPLSLNALCAACNQKSNREPVMSLTDADVAAAIERLRAKGLALDLSGGEHRVHKFAHRLGEVFNFDRREQAVLCVLLLRGPQTVGELRGRTERLHAFDDLSAVEAALTHLAERTPPLVRKLERQAGEKEPRYAHLLAGEPELRESPAPQPARVSPIEERILRVEEELAELRRQFEEFRRSFQ